jgi:hypothetical protein
VNKSSENPPPIIPHLDKNVPANWRPVAGLQNQPRGMMVSDRIWYWLLSLAGLVLTATGIATFWLPVHSVKLTIGLIVAGIVLFAIGPSQAARNGYRIH